MMKVNVRMNLSHFMNKPFEKEVIDKLSVINADSIVFFLSSISLSKSFKQFSI